MIGKVTDKNTTSFEARQFLLTNEIILWRAVIVRTVLDALDIDIHAWGSGREAIVTDAKSWFNKSNLNFNEVCDYANLQPTFVIKIYNKIVESNDNKLFNNKNLHKFLLEYLCTFTEEQ